MFIKSKWSLVKTVTAFTVAHSVTLALSVMGVVALPQGPVEAVIALSILFLARELVVAEDRRSALTRTRPWLMAFAFGLLHGFGFAGALTEIFEPAAKREVYRLSGGVPRIINVICDRALLGAYSRESRTVNKKLVRKAASEVSGQKVQPMLLRWRSACTLP